MTESTETEERRGIPLLVRLLSGLRFFVWTLALLLAYPLSVGPAVWLHNYGVVPKSALKILIMIYSPLERLSDSSEIAKLVLDWYVHLLP